MKLNKRIGILIVVTILGLVIVWWKRNNISGWPGGINDGDFQYYSNMDGKYSLNLPEKWKIEKVHDNEKFSSRIVISPVEGGFRAGNIIQLSITVVASPSAGQIFSKQEEFDDWRVRADQEATGAGLRKLASEEVAGNPAILLAEVDIVEGDEDKSFWSVTSWFRPGGINYYVNMIGNGRLTELEREIFAKILSSFRLE